MKSTESTSIFNLEKALKRLEEIVSHMEKDVLSIELALDEFEKGIRLVRQCQQALKEAEQKVTILMEKNGEAYLEAYPIIEKE